MNDPANRKKFYREPNNMAIVNIAVDEILLQENQKVSATKEAHENIESGLDEKNLYQINNMSLEDTKEKLK